MKTSDVITIISVKMANQNITQRELAQRIGITEASMSRYINYGSPQGRKMPFDVMERCLKALGGHFEIIWRE